MAEKKKSVDEIENVKNFRVMEVWWIVCFSLVPKRGKTIMVLLSEMLIERHFKSGAKNELFSPLSIIQSKQLHFE